ncbi:TIGR02285 family protein [Terasakiella sp. A23]|uniref:TIGR02285 family protein n=1 Tax=Terasakiella sp. FCG-A23 TaxID=3080561 RepID=UPI0029551B72|nr:TIGR02285 family protein [Terasakiella sp. A23]MDV7341128.1 TIGR02285 family protein [Terasakiella sp. A23]
MRIYVTKVFTFNILLCAILFTFTTATSANDNKTVRWALNDFIPFYLKDGPYMGEGISDKLTAFFQKHLPDYNHHQEQMNFPRFYALAKRGDLVCNPLLLKTPERENFLAYSRAFKPAYTHVLVSRQPLNYPSQGLSFEKFLKEESRNLIVQTKRSYGPKLDKIISQAKQSGYIETHNFPTKQLFVMLENGRIEYFLDIENSVTYYRAIHKGSTKFYNIPLSEDRLDRFGYATCSKTEEGQKLIKRINEILNEKAASGEFRAIVESWMAPENLPRFRDFYDKTILN